MRKNFKMELNPLFRGPSLESRTKTGSPYRVIPLAEIDVDPNQPRRSFSQEAIEELAASIKEYGVMNPILVSPTAGGTYRIIAGERRYRASKLLGLEAIPAIVDSDEEGGEGNTTLAKQLVENLQREDLSSLERATAIGQLRDRYGWSVREIAAKLGASKSLVQRSFDVLGLPDDLQAALSRGQPESKVLLLAQVEDRALRTELVSQLDELSREQLELKLKALLGVGEKEVSHGGTGKRRSPVLSPADRAMVDQIQKSLGTKVLLMRSAAKGEAGKLIVEFYSREDLDDLHRRLVS